MAGSTSRDKPAEGWLDDAIDAARIEFARRGHPTASTPARAYGKSFDGDAIGIEPASNPDVYVIRFELADGRLGSCAVGRELDIDEFLVVPTPTFPPSPGRNQRYAPAIMTFDTPAQDGGPPDGAVTLIGPNIPNMPRVSRGFGSLGIESYSLLSGYVRFALPHRLRLIRSIAEAALEAAASGDDDDKESPESFRMLHWLLVCHVGMLAEDLGAFLVAAQRWRDDGASRLAPTYLTSRATAAKSLADPRFRELETWRRLIGFNLDGSTEMTIAEAAALNALVQTALDDAREGVARAAAFMTPEVERLYARYKHSSALLSTRSTTVAVFGFYLDELDLDSSLLILDRASNAARPKLYALRVTPIDTELTADTAEWISQPLATLTGSILAEAESETGHGLLLRFRSPRDLAGVEQSAWTRYTGYDVRSTTDDPVEDLNWSPEPT